jgi:hypothetical protein
VGKYEEITKARQVLGLYESATLKDIKNNYKELLKEWHPDLCKENEEICKEKTIEIINFLFPRKKLKSIFLLKSFGGGNLEVTQYGVIIMMMNKINVSDYLSVTISS